MTGKAPAGWYPDPDRSDDGSPRERRWDGEGWTDEVRPAAVAPDVSAQSPAGVSDAPTEVISGGSAAPLGAEGPYGKKRWTGRRPLALGVAIGVAAAALVGGGIAGGYALWGGDDDDRADGGRRISGPDGGPGGSGGDSGRSPAPQDPEGGEQDPDDPDGGQPPMEIPSEDGFATDLASGIKIPVPDGWEGQSGQIGASVSVGEYKCPTSPEDTCVRGGVNSAPALALGIDATSPKTVAEKDIEPNAEASYGDEAYGGITSHDEVESGEVEVAGEEGYLVRWKVVTKEGDDGYVQSLAFPSPANPDTMVLVRAGFDIGDEAPALDELDEITDGIEESEGGAGLPGGGGQPVSLARP
ncbi:DUF2510 domain-containing protein [Streptomyces sp. WMMC500]|uniref:DUF2510 domain-containing protein n=1 Tax=Streptomyces sp. WMMC500 TaxID=3015154 RepID=UPI00248AEDFB|nr:DUF2510 domain-containing protein [Streptomyces sp. WMMC500]WBB58752.1 DUF2510 domain-containing protein [Streptomyces sp. WMMC500]